jgi:hypothetical protein
MPSGDPDAEALDRDTPGRAELAYGPPGAHMRRRYSNRVPPLKAYPEIKAQLHDIRAALEGCREWRKALVSMAGATAFAFYAYIPLGLFALCVFARALWHFYRYRKWLQSLTGMPCLDCGREYYQFLTFDPWVCGSCSSTHSGKGLTWADACECKAVAHSFICPECRKPIIFDDYAFERSPDKSAWLPGYPPLLQEEPVIEVRPPRPIDEELR